MPVLLGHLLFSARVNSTIVEICGRVPIVALSFSEDRLLANFFSLFVSNAFISTKIFSDSLILSKSK